MSKDTLPRSDLKPCPFCGATATMEELPCEPIGVRFSVGCDSFSEAERMGYRAGVRETKHRLKGNGVND